MRQNINRTDREIGVLIERLNIMLQWRLGSVVEFKQKNNPGDPWRTSEDSDWEPGWNWEQTDYRIKEGQQ